MNFSKIAVWFLIAAGLLGSTPIQQETASETVEIESESKETGAETSQVPTVVECAEDTSVAEVVTAETEPVETEITETAATEPVIVDREMTGEAIESMYLNRFDIEAYDDGTTDNIFSATWDLTAPEGERLVEFTGKPELFEITLYSDRIDVTEWTAVWGWQITDYTLRDIQQKSINQNAMEPWNPVGERTPEHKANEYLTAYVTTANGETIPMRVVWVYQHQGNGSYGFTYEFDRTITDEAVTLTVDFHLPAETVAETSAAEPSAE